MKLALLLLSLAAASGAPATTEDAGYEGETAEGYATYAPATMYTKLSACFNGCAAESPCFNKHTGQCAPTSCGYHANYAAYEPAETGYRRHLAEVSDNEYGYAAPENYDAAEYEPPRVNCGCPAGFKNVSCFNLQHNTVLWIAFALLFAPAFCFLWKGVLREKAEVVFDTKGKTFSSLSASWEEVTMVQICAGVVCAIASLAYLTMALGHGYINKCDGRAFYYARYVDWMLTTPLMLWDLCVLGSADSRTRLFILVMDVLMIGSGLIGGLIEGTERWAFFGFSMAAFLPIIYFLCWLDGGDAGMCVSFRATKMTRKQTAFQRAMNLTVLSWIGYPIVWAIAEGGENICANGEAIAYTVLDIISKSFFGFIIVFTEWGEYCDTKAGWAGGQGLVPTNHGGSSAL